MEKKANSEKSRLGGILLPQNVGHHQRSAAQNCESNARYEKWMGPLGVCCSFCNAGMQNRKPVYTICRDDGLFVSHQVYYFVGSVPKSKKRMNVC